MWRQLTCYVMYHLHQWSSAFLYNRPLTGTLLENRPLPKTFALSEDVILF